MGQNDCTLFGQLRTYYVVCFIISLLRLLRLERFLFIISPLFQVQNRTTIYSTPTISHVNMYVALKTAGI
jgi:hypothetical protein